MPLLMRSRTFFNKLTSIFLKEVSVASCDETVVSYVSKDSKILKEKEGGKGRRREK